MDPAVSDAFEDYKLMCELWAQARRHSEDAVVASMQAEDKVSRAEERLRFALTGEAP